VGNLHFFCALSEGLIWGGIGDFDKCEVAKQIFLRFCLVISEKSSNFAAQFEYSGFCDASVRHLTVAKSGC